jgi:hypothetical protein
LNTSEYVYLGLSYYVYVHFNTIARLISEFALLINSIFDARNLSTLRSSAYYLPFNEYPYYGHLQYPPPYSQRSFPPPFPPKQPFPPHVSHPLIFPTHPPSLTQRFSRHSSLRVERQVSNLHTRATSLKKLRRTSTNPPAFPTSGALSSIQLAGGRPHGWRYGYKSPSKSYFRRHFESFIAPYTFTSKLNHNFLISTPCERSTTFLISNTPLHVDATFKTQFPVGSDTCRSP